MQEFGSYIKERREELAKDDRAFTQRQISLRIGIEPSYLSKIERGLPVSLSEEKIILLAKELNVDTDYLLALGGKISSDVQEIIKSRPELFSKVVREMKNMPDEAIGVDTEFKNIMSSLNRLHDLASIGAFRFSNDPDASFWTEQIPTILGISPDQPPQLATLLSSFPQGEQAIISEAMETALKTGDSIHVESHIQDETNGKRYISLWGFTEPNSLTNDSDILGIVQDVTESTILQKEISSVQETLQIQVTEQAQTVANAVRDLRNENERRKELETRLVELNAQTTRRAQLQNQYFKEHAFQIRTLASYINLKQLPTSKDGYDPGKIISRIIHKINALGDFLQIEEGLVSDIEQFNPATTIQTILDSFIPHLQRAGINLHIARDPNLPESIQGDKVRIEQIIDSLLELVIQTTQWDAAHCSIRIPEASDPSLILSFYIPSVKFPLKRHHFYPSGTEDSTMGLDNPVQTLGPLLEELGGDLTVSAPSEAEAAIQIRIPIQIPDSPLVPSEQAIPTSEVERGTILVVEDDPHNMLFVKKGLEIKGYTVEAAETGKAGLSKAEVTPYQVILLDIQLPDLDGTEVAQTIRNTVGPNTSTPIIAVTAHATPSERRHFKSCGINEVVAKPFDLEHLSQQIISACSKIGRNQA